MKIVDDKRRVSDENKIRTNPTAIGAGVKQLAEVFGFMI